MTNEPRIFIFIFLLVVFSALEFWVPYRRRVLPRLTRWPANILMVGISNVLLKVIAPTGLIYFAELAEINSWGLLLSTPTPDFLKIILSVLILDFAIYLQHVITHKVQFLWRFHRVHHADTDLDATSALRFHPLEIAASFFYKSLWVIALGISAEAILIFEILLNSTAMFNHSNIYIPKRFEKFLRWVIVTPQMHIIHHSVQQTESDMNYGFNLPVWDRIFGTYLGEFSSKGEIGQTYSRSAKDHSLWRLLKLPFQKPS